MSRRELRPGIRKGAFRFTVYGAVLVFCEVAFYTVIKIGRAIPGVDRLFRFRWLVDPRLDLGRVWDAPVAVLYGQASLWMFLVYGSIGLFGVEPVYRKTKGRPWPLRGALYAAVILCLECVWGWLLRGITGYDIWYYEGPLTVLRYASLGIAPTWFVAGLVSENLIRAVSKSR
jgi:hypothetical protein